MRNILVVLSGPSGVGKGTVAKIISKEMQMALSISCTTRAPREGEEDGREYFFIDKAHFIEKINEGGFLEYSEHFENYYGTPKNFVQEKLKNKDVLLEIDVHGGLSVKQNFPSAILIMLAPPSKDEIFNRLCKRNTEPLEKVKLRMERLDFELKTGKEKYDYVVINDCLEDAVEEIKNIIIAEKNK